MNKAKILQLLQEIRNEVLASPISGKVSHQGTKKIKTVKNDAAKLKNAVATLLHERDFFEEGKTDNEVADELQKSLLTQKKPKRASVTNVLRSMVAKNLLYRQKINRGGRNILGYFKKKTTPSK